MSDIEINNDVNELLLRADIKFENEFNEIQKQICDLTVKLLSYSDKRIQHNMTCYESNDIRTWLKGKLFEVMNMGVYEGTIETMTMGGDD